MTAQRPTTEANVQVVLVRPKTSENVGAAARALANVGLAQLTLVAPRCSLDKSAYALASHGGHVLDAAKTVDDLATAVEGVHVVIGTSGRDRTPGGVPSVPPDVALADASAGEIALVFGPEDHGMTTDELDTCQRIVRIPTAEYASINLAQAVNLMVHRWFVLHAWDQREAVSVHGSESAPGGVGVPIRDRASRDQVERMYQDFVRLWHLIGYTDDRREAPTVRLFRGIFERGGLSAREVAALRGLATQAAWAARLPPERLPGARVTASEQSDETLDERVDVR